MNRAANAQGAASHAHAANEHAAAHNAKSHSSRNLLVPPPSKLSGRWVTDANGMSRYYTNDANEAHRMNKQHGARHDESFEAGFGAQHKTIKENKKDSTKQMLKEELEAMAANVDEEEEEEEEEKNNYIHVYIYICVYVIIHRIKQKLCVLLLVRRRLFSSLPNLILSLQLQKLHLFHVQLLLDSLDHAVQLFFIPFHGW